jgi:hypothetical protein
MPPLIIEVRGHKNMKSGAITGGIHPTPSIVVPYLCTGPHNLSICGSFLK